MPHRSRNNGNRCTSKRTRRLWLIPVGVALLAIIACVLWAAGAFRDRRSVEERLAEIEAARAIPDSENAAIIYNELLQDPNATSVMDDFPESSTGEILGRALREAWLSQDFPELVGWAKEHQLVIDRLLDASRLEKCRFPISIDIIDTSPMDRAVSMRHWGFLLSIAANNDMGEGRTDAALTKWRCLLRMESHLREQPLLIDHLLADGVGKLALESMARLIVTGNTTEPHLQEIEAMPLPMSDHWVKYAAEIREVEALRLRKMMESLGPLDRIKSRFILRRMNFAAFGTAKAPDTVGEAGAPYQRHVATARGIRILVALKRHKNTADQWPGTLDEIEPSMPREILTDPLNGGPFVYKPMGDTFTLYSKGENNIDEGGRCEPDAGPDDWPIWPPRGRMPEAEQRDVNEP